MPLPSMRYRDAVLYASPLAYWRLGELSGAVAADETGNGRVGAYVSAPTLGVAGAVSGGNTAVALNGTTQKITVASTALNLTAGPLSVAAWVNLSSGSSDAGIAGVGYTNGYQLNWHNGGGIYFYIGGGGNAANINYSSSGWHFVVGTWDGSIAANGIKLYIDGELVAQGTAGVTVLSATGFQIGQNTTYFNGSVDEVAVFSRALSADEIAGLYAARTYAPSLAGFLGATAREEILLCEIDPLYTLIGFTAVGGATPNTYSIALPRLVQTSYVKGGMYAKCLRVTADGVPLTERTSIALVEANPGSWYWDEANGMLYVRTATLTPASFTMLATRRMYFASTPVVLDQTAGAPTSGVYYLPWLTGDVPQVRRHVEDLLSGITEYPTGSVSFVNGHSAWFTLVAGDGLWSWKYSAARFYLGGRYNGMALTRADYAPIATMLVEDVGPTETACAFSLQPLRKLTDLELPITPLFETTYPNLGNGVRGTKKWIGYGRATIKPDLTDTTTSQGVYTVADAAYQTLFAINAVYAIRKDTGVWTQLTETTHYTKDLTACTVTIVSATYPAANYDIAVDVTGKPDGAGSYLKTYGAILKDIFMTFIGVALTDIDTAALTAADVEANVEIAVWVKAPRSIASMLSSAEPEQPSLGRSVMGTVQQTAAGQWTASVWDPSVTGITTTLRKEDLARFSAKPKLKTIYTAVRVYYNYDYARDQWSVVEKTDATVQYRTGSRDRLDIYTYLTNRSNAQSLAERYLLLAGAITVEAEFEERGALLAQMNAGGKVNVTFSPAPSAAGAYTSQPFEILDLTVKYAPKVTVSGILGDLRGLGGRIGRWTDPSGPSWSAATAAERLASGFWTDPSGFADPADPLSLNRSLWW